MIALTGMLLAQATGVACSQELPFAFREGLIWVQVRSPQAAGPLNFLLDTGAGVSVLNSRTAEKLGLRDGHQVSVQGVGASTTGYWPQPLTATAGEVPLPRDYLSVDLSELRGACKCAVDGLIGADFFHGRVVQIDFADQKIRLLASSPPAGAEPPIALKERRGAFRVQARVNDGAPQWFRFDTGCASALQWVASAPKLKTPERQVAVALTGISVPVTQTTVELGTNSFAKVPTGLHEKAIFSGEAGLIGNGLLARFRSVIIDARAGQVLLQTAVK